MTTDRRPDLVLIMTDQQRYDQVGWAPGSIVRTPNLDRLAASGVVFDNAYSASSTCVPARTSLMTGLFDHRTPYTAPYTLEDGFFTVPHALRSAGYQTALIGKMHFNPMRTAHGFEHVRVCEHLNAYTLHPTEQPELDHYHDWLHEQGLVDWRFEAPDLDGAPYPLDPSTHPTSWVRREAEAFLDRRDPDRPLFLVVSFPHPHPPVNPPEPYASMYDPADCVIDPAWAEVNRLLPTRYQEATAQVDAPHRRVDPDHLDRHRAELARTYGLITQVDDAVGALVDRLDLTDALVWFTSDHGDFAGHRGLLRKIPWIPFDDLAKVACFAAGGVVAPGPDGAGRREAAPMQSFDFATTCLELGGVDVDLDVFDGMSLASYLADPAGELAPDRVVFSAVSMKWPMVRRGPHKYLKELGWGQHVLFDVALDPEEHLDLANHWIGDRIVEELSAELEAQLRATVPDLPRFPPGSPG